jgi:ParB family chromosome partitioning protein
MDEIALQELADSIRARGVLQPLLVRPDRLGYGRFQIIAGERRWRAAALAGLHEVPALVRALDDGAAMAAALVENLQRQDLNALEEAEGYSRLLDEFGLTQEALAQAVGKSRAHIANTLRLLNLPPVIQQAVRAGTVTAGHARALLAHPSPEAALAQVVSQGLSVRQTEALAARKPPADTAPEEKDPNIVALERELSAKLGLRVEIANGARGGVVRFHYRNLEQLDAFLAHLQGALQSASLS